MAKLIINKKYGTAPNELLNNPKMSLKAKGLFTYLQSKPDGWKFSTERIAKQTKEGRDAVRRTLQELEKFGYLRRKLVYDKEKKKIKGYDYILSEKPILLKTNPTENLTTGFPEDISNKDISNKDIVKKNKNMSSDKSDDELFSFKNKLNSMFKDKRYHIRIIALYWRHKNFEFDNEKQYRSALARDLKPASKLVGYSEEDIIKTFNWLDDEEYLEKWTLETVLKYIDEVRKKEKNIKERIQSIIKGRGYLNNF